MSPSPQQRGDAAHIRQNDDNKNRTTLTTQERQMCNSVIHGRSMNHEPKYDPKLNDLKKKNGL
jgi:FixJ family two-component response regulator